MATGICLLICCSKQAIHVDDDNDDDFNVDAIAPLVPLPANLFR